MAEIDLKFMKASKKNLKAESITCDAEPKKEAKKGKKEKVVTNCGGIHLPEPPKPPIKYTIDDFADRMTSPFGLVLIDPETGKPIEKKSKE